MQNEEPLIPEGLGEELHRIYMCNLLHSRIPKTIMKYDEKTEKVTPEIVWVCKEGCHKKEGYAENGQGNKNSSHEKPETPC